jgi:hypothetical protein
MVKVAPVPVEERAAAAADVATTPVSPIGVDVGAWGETPKLSVASTPVEIVFSFKPQARHRTAPEVMAHDKDLPAAVVAAPAVSFKLPSTVVE